MSVRISSVQSLWYACARRGPTAAWLIAVCVGLGWAAPGWAGDYDRNDVAVRAVGLSVGIAPIERTTGCKSCSLPVATMVHGVAAHQRRNLYLGGEAGVGVTDDARPWLMAGALLGVETAASAQEKLRAYGEFLTSINYFHTRMSDTLAFSLEVGMRYQVRDYQRPHTLVALGVRVGNNLHHNFAMLHAGLVWTFD